MRFSFLVEGIVRLKMPKKNSKFAIQVAVRVRPLLSHDRSQKATVQTKGDVVCALDPEKLYGVFSWKPPPRSPPDHSPLLQLIQRCFNPTNPTPPHPPHPIHTADRPHRTTTNSGQEGTDRLPSREPDSGTAVRFRPRVRPEGHPGTHSRTHSHTRT